MGCPDHSRSTRFEVRYGEQWMSTALEFEAKTSADYTIPNYWEVPQAHERRGEVLAQ